MFIGRNQELQSLKALLTKRNASIVTVQGRRRIGKSTLIHYFCNTNKIPLYEFVGLAPRKGITKADQLDHFSSSMAKFLNAAAIKFKNWRQALSNLAALQLKQKSVVLLDEVSWMAMYEPDFGGYLKEEWDTGLSQNPNLILIVCGSVSSWIQENILDSTGFAGRISLELQLPELSIRESKKILQNHKKDITPLELAKVLSVVGGVPKYLEETNLKSTVENVLAQMIFSKNGVLFSEFEQIFSDVFGRRQKWYREILYLLKDGPKEPALIAEKLGLPLNGDFTKYLRNLELASFITRDFNWLIPEGKPSHLSKVRISDNYTRFYLKYVLPRKERLRKLPIKHNQGLELFNWHQIFGLQFENIILNNIESLLPLLKINPDEVLNIGPYFQTETKTKKGVQIDCMVQCKYKVLHLIECKTGTRIGLEVVKESQEKNTRLKVPRGFSIRNHLVYVGEISGELKSDDFFDKIVSFEELDSD